VVPAYNEEHTIASVLCEVYSRVDELVVVDDGSTDGTSGEIARVVARWDRASVISLARNQGVSAAYDAAFSQLADRLANGELDDDDLVITIDADGQHVPGDIDAFVEMADALALDAVVACRDLSYQSRYKRTGNWLMTRWASLWAGIPLHDVECGFRLVRLGALSNCIRYARGFRYSQPAQLAVVMGRLGYRVRNDVQISIPVSRSRTHLRNAVLHAVAIPWTALRVMASATRDEASRGGSERRAGRSRPTPGAVALVATVFVVFTAGRVMGAGGLRDALWSSVPAVCAFLVALSSAPPRFVRVAALVMAPLELVAATLLWRAPAVLTLAALGCGLTLGLLLSASPSASVARRQRGPLVAGGAVAVWLAALLWSGANDPAAAWFGSTISHGSRHAAMVAVTFDDGPDDTSTLAVADVFSARGTRASFFMVGSAIEARPELARAIAYRGDVVGNHSYRHSRRDWLVPDYPELAKAERVFAKVLGRCPAFFRPPYGLHDPSMANEVESRGMRTVTWDVSAADWTTKNPALVAHRVLAHVKAGSIILLHDGSNGDPTVDRSYIVHAVSLILDGLQARHLRPVGLDELLGIPPWLPRCPPA
jgi:peptidoglycan/xylan/chitin deacetylase (PgdA/CDA1 family)